MFKLRKKDWICAPVSGTLISLGDVNDETIASNALGDGFAITPTENKIYSPVNGKIEFVFRTKHAIGILASNGVQIIIHIGIDTVILNGEGFEVFVNVNDTIKKGELLAVVDFNKIKYLVPSIDVITLFVDGTTCKLTHIGEYIDAKAEGFITVNRT